MATRKRFWGGRRSFRPARLGLLANRAPSCAIFDGFFAAPLKPSGR